MVITISTSISAEGIQQRQLFLEEESIALKRAINREGIFLMGPRVQSLERFLQARYQVTQVLGTNAGTAALELACEGLKERLVRDKLAYRQPSNYWQIRLPGKNGKRAQRPALITTPLSYIATAYAASRAGFDLLFADIDARGNLDPNEVRRAFARRVNIVGILPVHLYGQPCDMAAFLQIAEEFGVRIIEDMAQAIDATYRLDEQPYLVGSKSFAAAISFYIGKNAGGEGDAGALLCTDSDLVDYLVAYRDQGRTNDRYTHPFYGGKYRMRAIDAAMIELQMRTYLADWTARRHAHARRYHEGLAELQVRGRITRLAIDAGSALYKYTVLCASALERDRVERHLKANGVMTERIYPRLIPDQDLYARGKKGTLPCMVAPIPAARDFSNRLLCLPMHEFLTNADVDRVIAAVMSAFARRGTHT